MGGDLHYVQCDNLLVSPSPLSRVTTTMNALRGTIRTPAAGRRRRFLSRSLFRDRSRPCRSVRIETGRPVHNVVRVRGQAGGRGDDRQQPRRSRCRHDPRRRLLRRRRRRLRATPRPAGSAGPASRSFPGDRRNVAPSPMANRSSCTRSATGRAGPSRQQELDADARACQATGSLPGDFARPGGCVHCARPGGSRRDGRRDARVREALGSLAKRRPEMPILADSRRGLSDFPPLNFKMNRLELQKLMGARNDLSLEEIRAAAAEAGATQWPHGLRDAFRTRPPRRNARGRSRTCTLLTDPRPDRHCRRRRCGDGESDCGAGLWWDVARSRRARERRGVDRDSSAGDNGDGGSQHDRRVVESLRGRLVGVCQPWIFSPTVLGTEHGRGRITIYYKFVQ